MQYQKEFMTFEEQAELIISRGMEADREQLIMHLKDVGYYRLSGYWHGFKNADNSFKVGTTFATVWNTYTFDRQLRLVVLDAIERVEIYFRTQLAYELACNGGPFGYMDPTNLPRLSIEKHEAFIRKCTEKHTYSREAFIEHFKKQYGDIHPLPPYWMLVGTMDFGQMYTLYKGASASIRNKLARELDLAAKVLDSWLIALNTVRNICAHHARLWNRVLGTKPIIPREDIWHKPYRVESERVFGVLTILSYLLERVAPKTKWRDRLFSLLSDYSEIPKTHMGFHQGWKKCPIWREHVDTPTCKW